jgi:hypothetical protein
MNKKEAIDQVKRYQDFCNSTVGLKTEAKNCDVLLKELNSLFDIEDNQLTFTSAYIYAQASLNYYLTINHNYS